MSAIAASSHRNWVQAVRRATPWAHAWDVDAERRLWSRAQLPNERLKALFDDYKKSYFGKSPNLFTGTVRGRDIYVFSIPHGLNAPATVFIHDRAGRLVNDM